MTSAGNSRRYPPAAIAGPVLAFIVTAVGLIFGIWILAILGGIAFAGLTFYYYVRKK